MDQKFEINIEEPKRLIDINTLLPNEYILKLENNFSTIYIVNEACFELSFEKLKDLDDKIQNAKNKNALTKKENILKFEEIEKSLIKLSRILGINVKKTKNEYYSFFQSFIDPIKNKYIQNKQEINIKFKKFIYQGVEYEITYPSKTLVEFIKNARNTINAINKKNKTIHKSTLLKDDEVNEVKNIDNNIQEQKQYNQEDFVISMGICIKNKLNYVGLIENEVINLAIDSEHKRILKAYSKENKEININCCEFCSSYIVGQKRCFCGNTRIGIKIGGSLKEGFFAYCEKL